MINKQEIKYIVWSGIFASIWFIFFLPKLTNIFDGNDPVVQFILFNVGLYIFFFIFLKSMITNSSVDLQNSLGLTVLFIGIDIIMPEYHVSTSGALIPGATLGVGASDYVIGSLIKNFGLSGMSVYTGTYIIAPILLFMLASLLIKNFVRQL